jgi:hypothetical protein
VFENRVLRRVFGPKRDEVIGGWRKLRIEELHNLYSLPGIIRIIKSRRIRWAGHVAWMGRRGMHIGFWWESQKERDRFGDMVDGRVRLRCCYMDSIDLAQDRDQWRAVVNTGMNPRVA